MSMEKQLHGSYTGRYRRWAREFLPGLASCCSLKNSRNLCTVVHLPHARIPLTQYSSASVGVCRTRDTFGTLGSSGSGGYGSGIERLTRTRMPNGPDPDNSQHCAVQQTIEHSVRFASSCYAQSPPRTLLAMHGYTQVEADTCTVTRSALAGAISALLSGVARRCLQLWCECRVAG